MFRSIFTKYKQLPTPVKASIWSTACYVIQRGLQFLSMPIYTRMMSAEEYGIYSVFLSWHSMICIFSSLCIYNGVFNKAMLRFEGHREEYVSSVQWLTLLTGLGLSGILMINRSFVTNITGFSGPVLAMLCLHIVLFPSLQYWAQRQRFDFAYRGLTIITLVSSLASLILGICLVGTSRNKGFALICVTVGVQAVVNIGLFASIAFRGKCGYKKDYWKWSVKNAVPLIPHYLSEVMLGHFDRLMINYMVGSAQAGIYNIVYQISMVMTILRTGINGAFIPWFYQAYREKKYALIKEMIRFLTLMAALLTMLLVMIGPELLKVAAPPSYYEAVIAIPSIMIASFFMFGYELFMNIEVYYGRNHYVSLASISAAILNAVLNLICIPRFGYLAASYTTMVSYIIMAVMHYLAICRIAKKYSEVWEILDSRFLLAASVGLPFIGILMLVIYSYTLLRWMLLAAVLIGIYGKRKAVLHMLKQLKK